MTDRLSNLEYLIDLKAKMESHKVRIQEAIERIDPEALTNYKLFLLRRELFSLEKFMGRVIERISNLEEINHVHR